MGIATCRYLQQSNNLVHTHGRLVLLQPHSPIRVPCWSYILDLSISTPKKNSNAQTRRMVFDPIRTFSTNCQCDPQSGSAQRHPLLQSVKKAHAGFNARGRFQHIISRRIQHTLRGVLHFSVWPCRAVAVMVMHLSKGGSSITSWVVLMGY
jgi:hypothetical protein